MMRLRKAKISPMRSHNRTGSAAAFNKASKAERHDHEELVGFGIQ